MKVEKIKRKANNYVIILENGNQYFVLNLKDHWEIKYELSEVELESIVAEDELIRAEKKIFSFISKRDYTEVELKLKLKQKGFSDFSVTKTVDKLKKMNLIDDSKAAQSTLRILTDKKPSGYLYVAKKLRERGVEKEVIEKTLEKAKERDEISLAFEVGKKCYQKYRIQKKKDPFNKVLSYLLRKGFSYDISKKVIRLIGESDEFVENA